MENENFKSAQIQEKSITISIMAGAATFGMGFFYQLLGVGLTGYKEKPFFYELIGYIIFWPIYLFAPEELKKDWSQDRYYFILIACSFSWSILVLITTLYFKKYFKKRN